MTKSLEELFEIAQQYGNVDLFQSDTDRTFSAKITFMTVSHTSLKAESGYRHKTIESALVMAIKKAEEIINSFTVMTGKEYILLK